MYVLCSKSHSSLFVCVFMGAVGARCCPVLLLAFLLICYLLLCSCNELSRLKSPIPVQNMPLCSGIQFFFADGGPLLGTLVATTLSSKMFLPLLTPMVHGHILILLVLVELDTDLRPYLLPSSQLIHLQATLNEL
jgi:hypothetical protein